MAKDMADVSIKANIDMDDFKKNIKDLQDKMKAAFGSEVVKQTQTLASSFSSVANSLGMVSSMATNVTVELQRAQLSLIAFLNTGQRLQELVFSLTEISGAIGLLSANIDVLSILVNSINFSGFAGTITNGALDAMFSVESLSSIFNSLLEKLGLTQVAFNLSTVAASTASLTFRGLAVATAMAFLPLVKIIAIAGIVAGVASLIYKSWQEVSYTFMSLGSRLVGAVGRIIDVFRPLGEILIMPFKIFINTLRAIVMLAVELFVSITEAVAFLVEEVKRRFLSLVDTVANVATNITNWLSELAGPTMTQWANDMIGWISSVINAFLEFIGVAKNAQVIAATQEIALNMTGSASAGSNLSISKKFDNVRSGGSGYYAGGVTMPQVDSGAGIEEQLAEVQTQKQAMAAAQLALEQDTALESLRIYGETEAEKNLISESAQEYRTELERLRIEETQAAEQQYYDWRMEAEEGFLIFQLEAMETFKNGFAEAFANAITAGEDLGKAIQDLGKQIINMFIQWQVKRLAAAMFSKIMGKQEAAAVTAQGASMAAGLAPAAWAKLVLNPGAGAFATASLSAGMASAAGIGAMSSMVSNIGGGALQGASTGIGDLPHMAKGGIVSRPTIALIGEGREAEAVIPLSKLESFVNANDSAGANVVYNQYGDISSEREFGDLLNDINDSIFASLRSG